MERYPDCVLGATLARAGTNRHVIETSSGAASQSQVGGAQRRQIYRAYIARRAYIGIYSLQWPSSDFELKNAVQTMFWLA